MEKSYEKKICSFSFFFTTVEHREPNQVALIKTSLVTSRGVPLVCCNGDGKSRDRESYDVVEETTRPHHHQKQPPDGGK